MTIPDRWLAYSTLGKCIAGTRFICFKVPLKDALCRHLQVRERFTPKMLIEQCPKLGLVIDLTNTARYYSGEIFVSAGIQYKKLQCPGQVIPPEKLVQEFFNTVDAFLDESHEKDKLIGVHCTHGLNRTGYFVCRYLSLRMGFTPEEAISAFEDARGYKIERQQYIEAILAGKEIGVTSKMPDSLKEHLQQNYWNPYEDRIEGGYTQNGIEDECYPCHSMNYQSPLAGCSYDNYQVPNRYSRFQPYPRNSPYSRPTSNIIKGPFREQSGYYGNKKWERSGDRGRESPRKM